MQIKMQASVFSLSAAKDLDNQPSEPLFRPMAATLMVSIIIIITTTLEQSSLRSVVKTFSTNVVALTDYYGGHTCNKLYRHDRVIFFKQ